MRVEKPIGNGDDTAANGLIVRCRAKLSETYTDRTIFKGLWGDWQKWSPYTPNYHVCSARIRFEKPLGKGDDTALNGIHTINCLH